VENITPVPRGVGSVTTTDPDANTLFEAGPKGLPWLSSGVMLTQRLFFQYNFNVMPTYKRIIVHLIIN